MDVDELASELSHPDVEVLRSIVEAGDSTGATTPDIRDATGLTNDQLRHRRDKLEEMGLIITQTVPAPTKYQIQPLHHRLTARAKTALSHGLYSKVEPPDPESLEEAIQQLNTLRSHVETLRSELKATKQELSEYKQGDKRRTSSIRDRLDELEAAVDELNSNEKSSRFGL